MGNNKKRILVTGGAGYIGSHTAMQLLDAGHEVVVLDTLYSGHRWAVSGAAAFVEGDIADAALIAGVINTHGINAVMHFAAYIEVAESVREPLKYYRNNFNGSLNLIETCVRGGVSEFVFSSTAAVYGIPAHSPVSENALTAPINPYGSSKLMTEWALRDLAAANRDFRFVSLRYFNVAGARFDGTLGQATRQSMHLIKVACEAACGARDGMAIYGDDYPTADGTCVRDYIHVEDLARAHLDALAYLDRGGESIALNCGYGHGYSVKEVVACVKEVSGVDFAVHTGPRRAGDPPELIAANRLIRERFGWEAKYDDLATICRTAYAWEQELRKRRERK